LVELGTLFCRQASALRVPERMLPWVPDGVIGCGHLDYRSSGVLAVMVEHQGPPFVVLGGEALVRHRSQR